MIDGKGNGWKEEEAALAKELYNKGNSASEISTIIGKSRNAILGRLFRDGVLQKGKYSNRAPRIPTKRKQALTPVPKAERKPSLPIAMLDQVAFKVPRSRLANGRSGGFVTVETLSNNTCRWPIGNPANPDFHFCGHEPEEGKPYCKYHEGKAHIGATAYKGFKRW